MNFEIPLNPSMIPPCDVCKSAPATIQFVEQRGSETRKISICQNCAAQQGIQQQNGSITFNLPSLLASLASAPPQAERPGSHTCPMCGMTPQKFQEAGRLGCARCFDVFAPLIDQVVARAQSGTAHRGLAPTRLAPQQAASELDSLRQKLKELVAAEKYEEAARLRDEIRGAEKQGR